MIKLLYFEIEEYCIPALAAPLPLPFFPVALETAEAADVVELPGDR